MRSTTIWLDGLGSSGIQRNVTGERSSPGALFSCNGLIPSRVNGALTLEPGLVKLYDSPVFLSPSGDFIRNFAIGSISNNRGYYMVWNGRVTEAHMTAFLSSNPATNGTPEFIQAITDDATIDDLSAPAIVGDVSVTPLGDDSLPVVTNYSNVDADIIQKIGRLGYPEISCDDVDSWFFPIFKFPEHNPYDGWGTADAGYAFQVGSGSGFYADVTSDLNTDGTWQHAYSNILDDSLPYGYGWGSISGPGADRRHRIKEFAVGYVYVYHDGTMSEMTIFKAAIPEDVNGTGFHKWAPIPFAPLRWIDSNNTKACISAFACRLTLPKEIIDRERTIKGVRVFYNHITIRSQTEVMYQGWTDTTSLINNMREANYTGDANIAEGMILLSGMSDITVGYNFGTLIEMDVYQSGLFYMPYELAVESYSEIVQDFYDRRLPIPSIVEPFHIGEQWGVIRGDLADGNAVIVTFRKRNINNDNPAADVTIVERGKTVVEIKADSDFGNTYEYGEDAVVTVRSRNDIYSAHIRQCFNINGRLWASGCTFGGMKDPDLSSLYISHVDPYGVPYNYSFTSAGRVPIARGEVRCVAHAYGHAIVGTTETVYSIDISGGDISSFNIVDLDLPGIVSPQSMVAVENTVYIATNTGDLYSFNPAYGRAVKHTDQIKRISLGDDTIVNDSPAVLRYAAVAHDRFDNVVYVSWRSSSAPTLSYGLCLDTGAIFTSNKSFVSACTASAVSKLTVHKMNATYLSSGNAVYRIDRTKSVVYTVGSGTFDYSSDGWVTSSGESIGTYSVIDKDFDSEAAGWTPGSTDPENSAMRIMVMFVPDGESGGFSHGWWYPCFRSTGFHQVDSYFDNTPSDGYGQITTAEALFTTHFAPFKSSCSRPPNYYVLRDDPSELEYDTAGNIDWEFSKEIPVPDESSEYLVTGVYINTEMTGNVAYDGTITVTVSDDTEHVTGNDSYVENKSQSRTLPARAFLRGRYLVPFRVIARRPMVKVSSSGSEHYRIMIRRLGVKIARLGVGRDT